MDSIELQLLISAQDLSWYADESYLALQYSNQSLLTGKQLQSKLNHMKLIPNRDIEPLPINNDPPDFNDIPLDLTNWILKFPYNILEEQDTFHMQFRCGHTVSPNPNEPNQAPIKRLRVTIDYR